MDLGLAFDDDDLNTTRGKDRDDIYAPYTVKTCNPQWFESALMSYQDNVHHARNMDPEQIPHMFKFSGDFHYHQKNYEDAAKRYKCALDLLPENNVSVRQDVRESLCRCYMYCGQTNDSLQMARDLVSEMSSQDEARQRQSLILLSFVCEISGRWAECVECLEKLCMKQAYFAQYWDQLGNAYMNLYNNSQEGEDNIHRKREATINSGGGSFDPEKHLVKPLTCYIRASLLFQSVMGTAGSLIKNRNESLIAKISKKIDDLPFSDTKKAFAFQHIQREFENQELDVENKLESKNSASQGEACMDVANSSHSQLFYNKFCSWYLKFGT